MQLLDARNTSSIVSSNQYRERPNASDVEEAKGLFVSLSLIENNLFARSKVFFIFFSFLKFY